MTHAICPACRTDHEPGRARIDRRTGEWADCWDMTEGAWALVKDPDVPARVKDWARGSLGIEDRRRDVA